MENVGKLNKHSLVLSCIEKIKRDIENIDPYDKKAKQLVNDLLYHYAWKLAEKADD